jgi:hypothetical protein
MRSHHEQRHRSPSRRTPARCRATGTGSVSVQGTHRFDRRRIDGRWTGGRGGAGRRPVRPGETQRAHRCSAAGIRLRLGTADGPVRAAQRPTTTLGGGTGGVPDRRRSHRTSRSGHDRRARVPVGVATAAARARRVEHHPGTPADAQPSPAVDGLPTAGRVGPVRNRRRLRDGTRVNRRSRLPHAR